MSEGINYDLEERTRKFGENVIAFAQKVPKNHITVTLITQLIKAGTSIGANYCEADSAESRKDFEHKLGICRKEAKETKYWLDMIIKANPELKEPARNLWQEAHELLLIFTVIIRKSKANSGR